MMNAASRHRVSVSGDTFPEMCKNAADIFDAYFGREILWSVTHVDSDADVANLQSGIGATAATAVASWHAIFEAEVLGVSIGTESRQPALWFA